jgi:hypothetical protein
MQTLDPPLVSALVALGAAVLMVQAGVGKRLLSWRPARSARGGREGSAATAGVGGGAAGVEASAARSEVRNAASDDRA